MVLYATFLNQEDPQFSTTIIVDPYFLPGLKAIINMDLLKPRVVSLILSFNWELIFTSSLFVYFYFHNMGAGTEVGYEFRL